MLELFLHLLEFGRHKLALVLSGDTGQKVAGFKFQCLLKTRVQALVNGNS
jgi:hypothetical protein